MCAAASVWVTGFAEGLYATCKASKKLQQSYQAQNKCTHCTFDSDFSTSRCQNTTCKALTSFTTGCKMHGNRLGLNHQCHFPQLYKLRVNDIWYMRPGLLSYTQQLAMRSINTLQVCQAKASQLQADTLTLAGCSLNIRPFQVCLLHLCK